MGLPLILLGLLLASCTPERPSDPVSIVQAAYDHLNNGDLDGYMSLPSDDVVIMDKTGRREGAEVIRADLERSMDPQHIRLEPRNLSADGDVVIYTLDDFEKDQRVHTYDVVVDIIADGKIRLEGPQYMLVQECDRDPSQATCP
jgi:ketosteroid isomerase-like protein